MQEKIKQIKEQSIKEITLSEDLKSLDELRVKYLGKKGELTQVLRGMGAVSAEERPVVGALVNSVRDELEDLISKKEKDLKQKIRNRKYRCNRTKQENYIRICASYYTSSR